MKTSFQILLYLFLSGITFSGYAQYDNSEFRKVDTYIQSLKISDTLNMGTISYLVTKNFSDSKEKARAIYDWITGNIAYDCKTGRSDNLLKISSDQILKTKKANSAGFAALFQDMCSVVKIRCLTVDGFIKKTSEDINEPATEKNHAWDVVQLGPSSDTWYYVDPTWGSGYTDEKITVFTKSFNGAYFFSPKEIFNMQHYPDNLAWLLGPGAKSKKEFFQQPIVRSAAYDLGLIDFTPPAGIVKGKAKKALSFNLHIKSTDVIEKVSLETGSDKKKKIKPVDFKVSGSSISFNVTFDEEDSFPATILVNNQPVLTYLLDIKE